MIELLVVSSSAAAGESNGSALGRPLTEPSCAATARREEGRRVEIRTEYTRIYTSTEAREASGRRENRGEKEREYTRAPWLLCVCVCRLHALDAGRWRLRWRWLRGKFFHPVYEIYALCDPDIEFLISFDQPTYKSSSQRQMDLFELRWKPKF